VEDVVTIGLAAAAAEGRDERCRRDVAGTGVGVGGVEKEEGRGAISRKGFTPRGRWCPMLCARCLPIFRNDAAEIWVTG
jgi:hypothetical protein